MKMNRKNFTTTGESEKVHPFPSFFGWGEEELGEKISLFLLTPPMLVGLVALGLYFRGLIDEGLILLGVDMALRAAALAAGVISLWGVTLRLTTGRLDGAIIAALFVAFMVAGQVAVVAMVVEVLITGLYGSLLPLAIMALWLLCAIKLVLLVLAAAYRSDEGS
jgi:hypothetical protein